MSAEGRLRRLERLFRGVGKADALGETPPPSAYERLLAGLARAGAFPDPLPHPGLERMRPYEALLLELARGESGGDGGEPRKQTGPP